MEKASEEILEAKKKEGNKCTEKGRRPREVKRKGYEGGEEERKEEEV